MSVGQDDRAMTTAPSNGQPLTDHGGHDGHEVHDHDRGLAFDLSTLLNRRRMLQLIGGAGVLALAGCAWGQQHGRQRHRGHGRSLGLGWVGRRLGHDGVGRGRGRRGHDRRVERLRRGRRRGDGRPLPRPTARTASTSCPRAASSARDIRSSFGSSSGTAEGVPLDRLPTPWSTLPPATRLSGAAVYTWHCDRDGQYSLYSQGAFRPELPAGRPGDGRRRRRHLHDHLPRVLLG